MFQKNAGNFLTSCAALSGAMMMWGGQFGHGE
jgi:hypothetical protein